MRLPKDCKTSIIGFKKTFSLQGYTIYISACIGISSYPKDGKKAQMLINYADEAMRHAKIFGPHQIIFFDPIKHLVEFEQLLLSQDLKQAFIKHQLEVYFQPILECQHKKILKAEALLRWNHPSKGIMTTIEFLPLIKRNDAIIEINLWIFKEVCRHLQQWLTNYPDLQISINTPALLFEYPDHPFQHWQHILETYQIKPNRIIIEITEEALFRPNIQTLKKIKMLQDQGFGLALDDFGTGYTSIEYLKYLNPNYLKLNHVFTKHVLDNQKNELLYKTMIDLAHGLHMKVIAENVEKIEIQNKLEQLGIDFSQGYLIGIPMDAVNFEQHLG